MAQTREVLKVGGGSSVVLKQRQSNMREAFGSALGKLEERYQKTGIGKRVGVKLERNAGWVTYAAKRVTAEAPACTKEQSQSQSS